MDFSKIDIKAIFEALLAEIIEFVKEIFAKEVPEFPGAEAEAK